MPITRDFRETILKRAVSDPKFRKGMLEEAINEFLGGNIDIGKKLLRNYINATITFQQLAMELNKSSKSIHRMLGPQGNPRLESILGIIKILQTHEKVKLKAKVVQHAA